MNATAPASASRLLPRTLVARLLWILTSGLLLAHTLSFALLFYERAVATRSMMLTNLEQDIPLSIALLERLRPEERRQWLPQLERRTYRYLLRPAAPGTPLATARSLQATALVDAALSHRYELRPRAVSTSPERYEVELTLADGQPVTIEVTPSLLPMALWLPWVLVTQVILLLACAWLAVRLATRPLVRLAEAAERLDPARPNEPLPQDGPAEVEQAARALNALQQRVADHVAERMQILAAISHDLQTPMTRMRLRLESMDESSVQERLLEDVDHISQLVREGVNYARSANVATGPAVRLDVQAFLDSVAGDYQDVGKPVQSIAGDTVSLMTHPPVLRRIVQNLVDNALAYAGSAEVRSRVDADGRVCIDVLDRGPGIPEDQREAALQPFRRLEPSRGRSSGGTGLGLAIAQQLAQALDGRLLLSDRDGGGLCVTIAFSQA